MTLPMPLPTTPPAPGRVLPTTVIGSFNNNHAVGATHSGVV